MNIVFMGTPDFAVPTLQILLDRKYTVQAVVTQPDRPKGRGRRLVAPPVKVLAEKYDIPVMQPEKLRKSDCIQALKDLAPDAIVVVAYGQILPVSILNIPPLGCINIHGSLLPKYRGAAPIHRAIVEGEAQTGITTMCMDKGLDTGDMLLKKAIAIGPADTCGSLHDTLSLIGAELLIDTLEQLEQGSLERIPQDDRLASYAPMLKKEEGQIDWNEAAHAIDCKVRGLFPWPGAYTSFQGKMVKLLEVAFDESPPEPGGNAQPGEVLELNSESGPLIACGEGSLRILRIQPQNKKAMTCSDFCRGYRLTVGTKLGA